MKPFRIMLIIIALLTAMITAEDLSYAQSDEELDRIAEEHFRNRDFPRAVETWKKILEKNPGDARAKSRLDTVFQAQYAAELEIQKEKHEKLKNPASAGEKEIRKDLSINWNAVDGAVKYQVQVMDSKSALILDKVVETNSIQFTVPTGEYRMRVGAINMFDRIGAWSDWSELKIMRREAAEAMTFRGIIDHGFTFAAGYTQFQVLSQFKEQYDNSSKGWTMIAGYRLRSSAPLSGVFLVRNLGLEIELSNLSFSGKTFVSIRDSSLEILAAGGNLKYTTAFNFPLNLTVRAGIGAAFTDQQYKVPESGGVIVDSFRISSTDPYYKAGLSLVLDFYHSFFLEAGADYCIFDYLGDNLYGARYFFMAGMKI